MADISKDDLRKEITGILKSADLTSMSAKKVRQQIEEKLDVDLTERKKEIDDLVMECLQEKTDSNKKSKKKPAAEESEDGDEEEEEEEEGSEEEEEEEEEKKPAKRAAQTKAKKPVKRKKGSSDEDESASGDEDASDEDYKPKKAKSSPKKGKKGAKKKDGESDSDSDWGKKKGAKKGAAKKGGRKGGGGYTRAITLTPELAAVVGAEQLPRHEVVKKIWSIIKEKNLYDPKNKQYAICDDELMKIFGVKRFRTFGMMKYLKNHFVD